MKKEKKGAGKPALKSRKDINREGQVKLNAELNEKAQTAGWRNWSDFRTAVRNGWVVIPQKQN